MYRAIREATVSMAHLEEHLRRAILANDTREITSAAGAAQALTIQVLDSLKEMLSHPNEQHINRTMVEAAVSALNLAWTDAEKVAIEPDASGMRGRLVDFKTNADHATAYLRSAIGGEEE